MYCVIWDRCTMGVVRLVYASMLRSLSLDFIHILTHFAGWQWVRARVCEQSRSVDISGGHQLWLSTLWWRLLLPSRRTALGMDQKPHWGGLWGWRSGNDATAPCLNSTAWIPSQYKKRLSKHRDFHYKDKTVRRPTYHFTGNDFTVKTCLY